MHVVFYIMEFTHPLMGNISLLVTVRNKTKHAICTGNVHTDALFSMECLDPSNDLTEDAIASYEAKFPEDSESATYFALATSYAEV